MHRVDIHFGGLPGGDTTSQLFQDASITHSYRDTHSFADTGNLAAEQSYSNTFKDKEDSHPVRNHHASTKTDTSNKGIRRRSSFLALAGLFAKSKLHGKHDELEVSWEDDESGETSMANNDHAFNHSLDANLATEIDVLPAAPPTAGSSEPNIPNSASRVKQPYRRETSMQKTANWDPPPLFQAYPQAIKHATLRAPSISAEVVLRLYPNRAPPMDSSMNWNAHELAKPQRERKPKRHTAAEVLSRGEWTHKVFVLVTSGYLLQYTGEGNFDRLPEKILPLTTESAAFASDAIPGQPYVLQVSQVSDDQGTLDTEASRSMLKKLGLRNEVKRSASTFLLVLETSEEMSAWLVAVRKEIHAMGGKEYKEDEPRIVSAEESYRSVKQRPSQRYLVTRDPNRFSDKLSKSAPCVANNPAVAQAIRDNGTVSMPPTSNTSNRLSLATQSSTASRSGSSTTASTSQYQLDQLRENPRESYSSVDAKTASTSRSSSPERSPEHDKPQMPDLTRRVAESRSAHQRYSRIKPRSVHDHTRPNAAYREPLRPSLASSLETQTSPATTRPWQSSSPETPNFSVPIFSKRYSTAKSSTRTSVNTPNPPITFLDLAAGRKVREGSEVIRQPEFSAGKNLDNSSLKTAGKICEIENTARPRSSPSDDYTPSRKHQTQFSCPLSSIQRSQGGFPDGTRRQSTCPHAPPTAGLPRPTMSSCASPYPPPRTALPPVPSDSKLGCRFSMLSPPPSTSLPPLPTACPPLSSSNALAQTEAGPTIVESRAGSDCPDVGLPGITTARPAKQAVLGRSEAFDSSVEGFAKTADTWTGKTPNQRVAQTQNGVLMNQPPPTMPRVRLKSAFEAEGLTPPLDKSPPKPTRAPPPLPVPQERSKEAKFRARIGREPPPVCSPATSPRPRISISTRAESYFDGPAPHPFIPPIRVSERKFRGSLDGPWNITCDAPQRTFWDLSVT